MSKTLKKNKKEFSSDYWLSSGPETKPPQITYSKKKKKVILTVTVTEESYQKLKRLIPEGEVSKFVDKIVRESTQKIENKISIEYEELNQDQNVMKKLERLNICYYEKNQK